MKSKKAQLEVLMSVIMSIMFIGIIIGVGFMVLDHFQTLLTTETATINNETVTSLTDAGKYVTKNSTTSGINCYADFMPLIVTNSSDGILISSGNYSYNSDGKIWNISSSFSRTAWNVTYSYNYGKEGCAGVKSTLVGLSGIPGWIILIIILAIVGILLAIVFRIIPSIGAGGTIAEI